MLDHDDCGKAFKVDLYTAGYERQLMEAKQAVKDLKNSNLRGVRGGPRDKPDLVSQIWDETFAEMNKGRIFVDDSAQLLNNKSTEKKMKKFPTKSSSPLTSTTKSVPAAPTSPHIHIRLDETDLLAGPGDLPLPPTSRPLQNDWFTTQVTEHCHTSVTTKSTRHQSPARMPVTARDLGTSQINPPLPRAAVWSTQPVPGISGRSGGDRRRRAKMERRERKMSERTAERLRERRSQQLPWDSVCAGDINISYPHFETSDEEEDNEGGDASRYFGPCGC